MKRQPTHSSGLLSALPPELRDKVVEACNALAKRKATEATRLVLEDNDAELQEAFRLFAELEHTELPFRQFVYNHFYRHYLRLNAEILRHMDPSAILNSANGTRPDGRVKRSV